MNDETAREKLAGALRDSDPIQPPDDLADYYAEADALLPVVREIAAEELDAMADVFNTLGGSNYVISSLIDRADALRTEAAS